MVRLQQSYSPHSGVLPERAAHFAVNPAECRDGRADSRERDPTNGGPSLFQPGDRIVDEYSKEEFHVDQYLGKAFANLDIIFLFLLFLFAISFHLECVMDGCVLAKFPLIIRYSLKAALEIIFSKKIFAAI
ncbi:unnamed protein product [Strongylus vulgaris]|uniref:Uncharacterized protein n=1 Tax=Strongylus vulgaris TaxID=40348 RepID=A0A3P7IK00_STRVU|nr:unnamed protein product [Strongylus vulgaris]